MTSQDARSLRQIFWQTVPPDVTTADGALAYARQSPYIVINVSPRAGVADDLRSMGEPVFETPWGSVIVDDTPEKRMGARLLARALISRERNSIRMLEELLPSVDSRVERERPEGREGGRRIRQNQEDEESNTE